MLGQGMNFPPSALGAAFDFNRFVVPNVDGNSRLIAANSNRVYLSISIDQSGGPLFVSLSAMDNFGQGWVLNTGDVTVLTFLYRDIGPVVGYEWFSFGDGFGTATVVHEVTYNPTLISGLTRSQQDVLRRREDRTTGESGTDNQTSQHDIPETLRSVHEQIIRDLIRSPSGNDNL